MGGLKFGQSASNKEKKQEEKTVIERLADLEKENKQSKQENEDLKGQIESLGRRTHEAEKEAGINSMRQDVMAESRAPYPTERYDSTPKYILLKEKEFAKYGVGKNSLQFDLMNKKGNSRPDMIVQVEGSVTYDGQVINILYARNHASPFCLHHPAGGWTPESGHIIFQYGSLIVPASNPGLQSYLISHKDYGKKWMIYDEDLISKIENEEMDKMEKAANAIAEMFSDSDPNTPRYFAMSAIGSNDALNLKEETLRVRIRKAAMAKPELIADFVKSEWQTKYVCAYAHHRGFIIQKGNTVYFSDGRPICSVEEGQEMYEAFYQYCRVNPSTIVEVKEKTGLK